MQQSGARWLAQQQHDFGEADPNGHVPTPHHTRRQDASPRFNIVDHMSDRALVAWCEVLAEYGLMPSQMV